MHAGGLLGRGGEHLRLQGGIHFGPPTGSRWPSSSAAAPPRSQRSRVRDTASRSTSSMSAIWSSVSPLALRRTACARWRTRWLRPVRHHPSSCRCASSLKADTNLGWFMSYHTPTYLFTDAQVHELVSLPPIHIPAANAAQRCRRRRKLRNPTWPRQWRAIPRRAGLWRLSCRQ